MAQYVEEKGRHNNVTKEVSLRSRCDVWYDAVLQSRSAFKEGRMVRVQRLG
jgi:hypothetical protein